MTGLVWSLCGYVRPRLDMSDMEDELQQKNRSGFKMMNLEPDKLTTSKQDTIE
jgi:hypothetical protein